MSTWKSKAGREEDPKKWSDSIKQAGSEESVQVHQRQQAEHSCKRRRLNSIPPFQSTANISRGLKSSPSNMCNVRINSPSSLDGGLTAARERTSRMNKAGPKKDESCYKWENRNVWHCEIEPQKIKRDRKKVIKCVEKIGTNDIAK